MWTIRHIALLLWTGLLVGGPFQSASSLPAPSADSISASSWLLLVEAAIGGAHDSSATFGVRGDATPGFDAAYDQPSPPHPPGAWVQAYFPHAEAGWPTLLGDRFAVDIQAPASPGWTLRVESTLPSGTLTLSWDTSGLSALGPAYAIRLIDTAAQAVVDMRHNSSHSFAYDGPRSFTVDVVTPDDMTLVNVLAKWNIVSLPRLPTDSSAAALFSSATSAAYSYNAGYQPRATLAPGVGYWLKFGAAEQVAIGGAGVASLSVPVREGWNLVGTVDHPVPAPSGGLVSSPFFGYAGRYVTADTLRPGSGYWVKASADGMLAIGAAAPPARGPAALPECASALTVRDGHGLAQSVYFVPSGLAAPEPYDLPPAPPAGAFDVRFASNRYGEAYDADAPASAALPLRIASPRYPLFLDAAARSGAEIECSIDGGTWRSLPLLLDRDAEVRVRIRHASAPAPALPADAVLEQNYPNPWNPSTVIRYTLPERSEVRLSIVTLLGKMVAVLADGVQERGMRQVALDAAALRLASGAYWYRLAGTGLETGRQFNTSKKFLHLR